MCLAVLHVNHREKRNLFLGTRIQRASHHFVVFVVWGYFSHWFYFQIRHNIKITQKKASLLK